MKVVVCVKQTPSTTAVFSVKDGAVSWEEFGKHRLVELPAENPEDPVNVGETAVDGQADGQLQASGGGGGSLVHKARKEVFHRNIFVLKVLSALLCSVQ